MKRENHSKTIHLADFMVRDMLHELKAPNSRKACIPEIEAVQKMSS
jgi:hypothetical protein